MILGDEGWSPAPMEPVDASEAVRALLAEHVGFGHGGLLRETRGGVGPWLLHAATATDLPAVVGAAQVVESVCLGPVDRARLASPARLELEVKIEWESTLARLAALAVVPDRPTALRYLTVVADQYDKDARRVQRVSVAQARLSPLEFRGRESDWMAVQAQTRWPPGWWASYPVDPLVVDAREVDVLGFGWVGVVRTDGEWPW